MNECAFCGHPDSRHRVVDTIRERESAGEPLDLVLEDYGWTLDQLLQTEREVADAR